MIATKLKLVSRRPTDQQPFVCCFVGISREVWPAGPPVIIKCLGSGLTFELTIETKTPLLLLANNSRDPWKCLFGYCVLCILLND